MFQTRAANFDPEGNGLHSCLCSYHPAVAEFIQLLQVAQFASQNRIEVLLMNPLAVGSASSSQIQATNDKL